MNKRISMLCTLFVLVLVSAMLFGACGADSNHGGEQSANPETEASTEATEATTETAEGTESTEAQTEPPRVPDQPTAELGVGERGDYNNEDTTPQQTGPAATTPDATDPSNEKPEPSVPAVTVPEGTFDPNSITMEMWDAMSPEEQDSFMYSFPTMRDFAKWFNEAKEKESSDSEIISGGDKIDLGEIIKP